MNPISRRKSGMTEFDPAEHRMVPQQRWFEDFVLGERFVIPSRTMTTAVFSAFQAASSDTHPVHYDVEYCRAAAPVLQSAPDASIKPENIGFSCYLCR